MTSLYLRIAFFSIFLLTGYTPSTACEYRTTGSGVSTTHPREADVTSALSQAITAGILQTYVADQGNGKPVDKGSTIGHLQRFGNALALSGVAVASDLSMLLVENDVWSRYHANPDGVAFQILRSGAQADETIVITAEAVLRALEDGVLSSNEAVARGLIVIVSDDTIDKEKVLSAFASLAKADNPDQIVLKRSRASPDSTE